MHRVVVAIVAACAAACRPDQQRPVAAVLLALAARGQNPPGIRAAMHPRCALRSTHSRCKEHITLCQSQYTFGDPNASLCVAPRANSPAIHLSSRLASPAPRRSRCSVGFIHGLLGVAACQSGDAAEGRRGTQLRDSAGIRIVENPAPSTGSRLGWRIGPEPTISIARMEGEDPYLLYRAMDATILADGRILVANGGSGELRFFDAKGSHLATRGGQGGGPGEFLQLRSLEPWPADSVAAWFGPRHNISVFDSGGNYGRTIEINDASDPWAWRLASTSVRGSILAVLLLEYADTLVVELRDGEGRLRTSLGAHPSWDPSVVVDEGTDREMQHAPTFGRKPVWGFWGDLVAIGVSSRYEIRAYGADGSLARIVRREHSPRVPTPEDVEAYIESRILLYYPDATPSEQEYHRRNYRSAPVAGHFPAFTSIMVDALDHLWIREYDLPREERPAPLWTVFDPEGHVLGFVETPAALGLVYEIGEDYIMGHSMDELGVEMIQVWPLARRGG